jgi:hypothetical protein
MTVRANARTLLSKRSSETKATGKRTNFHHFKNFLFRIPKSIQLVNVPLSLSVSIYNFCEICVQSPAKGAD